MAGNKRNARTTFPRVARRRRTALETFTVKRASVNDEAYMTRKRVEFLALGGSPEQMQYVPQRLWVL